MQNKQQILEKLYSLQRFGIKPGLERTFSILYDLGNPHEHFLSIHVAGTNGKGFTCSAIASVLMDAGYKVGLYTSPHLKDFNERIIVNGEMISDDDIITLAEQLIPYSESIEATFFEITTAMAFHYFSKKNVDIAVIETGMGGRFDSTNVIKPLASVITDIGLEHQEYLGDTLAKIALEKAGIIKKNVPVLVSKKQEEVLSVFINKANEMKSPINYPENICDIRVLRHNDNFTMTVDICSEDININELTIPVAGNHQIRNLLLALSALLIVKQRFAFTKEEVIAGLRNVRENTNYRCRLELIRNNPKFLIDTAHNPQAIQALSDTLVLHGHSETKWNILYAAMGDKDVKSILNILKPHCKTLNITKPQTERSMPTKEIAQIAEELGYLSIIQYKNSQIAYTELTNKDDPVLCCGSFFLVGEVY